LKTYKIIFFFTAFVGLLAGCDTNGDFLKNEIPELKKAQVVVSVPFKANFTVWAHSDYSDRSCGDIPVFHLTMIGEGVATHLGKSTVTMTFCCNSATGEYWDTYVIFIAADGDELYASIPIGYIVPNDEKNSNRYSSKFIDEMYFIGGTGRFEGASGKVMTNAYVHEPTDDYFHKGDEVWHTDFFSKGTINLLKGEK